MGGYRLTHAVITSRVSAAACHSTPAALLLLLRPSDMVLAKTVFDEREKITQYSLSSQDGGLVVKILDYGATISHLLVRDGAGVVRDVVLGFDSFQGYQSAENAYFGCVVGRVANRIRDASFLLNGRTHHLERNASDGRNHLHGGFCGFDKRKWSLVSEGEDFISLEYTSADGEEGYPGAVTVTVTYSLVGEELRLEYTGRLSEGETQETIINLTNHTYFNLSGACSEQASKILDHRLVFSEPRARNVVAVLDKDDDLIPTGESIPLASDAGAAFDFYQGTRGELHTIGSRIDDVGGYDHALVFADRSSDRVRDAFLKVWSPLSNICLTMSTSEPAVQLYTGEFLSERLVSKASQGKVRLGKRSGFCLEANRYPDAIHQPEWREQVVLRPGQVYRQTTVYRLTAYHSGTPVPVENGSSDSH